MERCLQSVQGIVDEIIIVDTGSTDGTKEIARRYTNKVYDFQWINDFAAARNFALEYATSEYILQLDADEVLVDSKKELQQKFDKDFYYLRIKNDLGSGQYLSHQFIRLFRNSPDIRYQGALHEQVPSNFEIERYGYLSSVGIFHEGYKLHLVKSKQKLQRNLNILMKEIKERPTAFAYYNLGMQYIIEEKYHDALKALKKSYSYGSHYAFTPKVILDIMKCLQNIGQYQEAIKVGLDAVVLYEGVPDFWYQMGLVYTEWGLIKDAQACFEQCLEIGEENTARLVQHYDGTGSYLAQGKLAEIHLILDHHEQALQYILQAVKASPDTLALFDIFLSIYPSANKEELFHTISSIWPFSSQRYIELIGYLYHRRNPLLCEFLSYFEMEVVYPVSVFSEIVAGNYEQARSEILNNKKEASEQDPHFAHNLLFLSLATNDSSLLEEWGGDTPLSSKELKWFKKLLDNKIAEEISASKTFQAVWKQLVIDAIQLQKYEYIDLLINATNQSELRLLIAECLQSFGFDDLAIQVLVETNNRQLNYKIYLVAAKSLRTLGATDDALFYLEKAEQIKKDFSVMFEKWQIYHGIDKKAEREQLQIMHDSYPDSNWVNQALKEASF
ncbi:glycosyltransferase family 2 protein [Paenibacillus sp. MSJ-6]|uniref:Glycosyltransferase family 2 protein n=1 Tax=Paenibacillus brevis TaxID=2841508 RepID=A0ABS6FL84_9BACL|nr:glycosyltransferase family 2 protein [Paenibacillus brevis]